MTLSLTQAERELREAEEEVGLRPQGVEVFAELPELWLPPSNFAVTPANAARESRGKTGRRASNSTPRNFCNVLPRRSGPFLRAPRMTMEGMGTVRGVDWGPFNIRGRGTSGQNLVRQRQAWPTPAGKMGRIYVMADGLLRVVEAEDNFVRWEEAHVVWGRGDTGGRD